MAALSSLTTIVEEPVPPPAEEADTSNPYTSRNCGIGGSFIGSIIDGIIEQQKSLMDITLNALYQFGLNNEAASDCTLADYNASMDAAEVNYNSGYKQAMELFTSCATSGFSVLTTVGTLANSHIRGSMRAGADQAADGALTLLKSQPRLVKPATWEMLG